MWLCAHLSGARSIVVPRTVTEAGMSSEARSLGVLMYVSTPTCAADRGGGLWWGWGIIDNTLIPY
jgi:hypothetical protein